MTHFQIREKFLQFFKSEKHAVLPSSSLIPQNDPSLLFVNAGMNQFKNLFLGLETPKNLNVVTIQKCLRAGGKHNDIENVGETSWHHTFFEMMGNFSFGDYFKKRAIELAWKFLVTELRFSENHLWITVFEEDEESYEIWKNHIHIPEHKILRLGKKSNFWQMGDIGPCGPCSEIHYYNGSKKNPTEDDLVEIWNLVFMEFYDTEGGKREPLPKPCVDTGLGLERLSSLVQGEKSNYNTDLFKEIIQSLEKHSSFRYNFLEQEMLEEQVAFRVIADHSRALSFLVSDGVIPGSDGSSYVLRRIMRRAFYYSQKLNPKVNLLEKATEKVIDLMSPIYPYLKKEQQLILSVVDEETDRFSKSLETGRKKLKEKMKSLPNQVVDFETAWDLYSTYGFPIDLTRLIAKEKNYKMIDEETFEKEKSLLEKNQKVTSSSEKNHLENLIKNLQPIHLNKKTLFTGYETSKEKATILFLFQEEQSFSEVKKLDKNTLGWLVTDKTCFYPEGGGPIGDRGKITTQKGTAEVLDTLKRNQVIFHKIKILEGTLNQNSSCELQVNSKFRSLISTSHSATHLLNASLRKILGSTVRQAGSLVEPGYLRFDFTHPQPLTEKQLEAIENDICEKIQNKEEVSFKFLPYKQALQEGALSLRGENYDDEVRVIFIGNNTSIELCGGIHVKNLGEIGSFKIITETGVQSGVRRIAACTSLISHKWEEDLKNQVIDLAHHLNISKEDLNQKENPFFKWEAEQNKKISILKNQIVNLKSSATISSAKPSKSLTPPKVRYLNRHLFTSFNLELRKHLELSTPKEIEVHNPFLNWVQKKQNQLQDLQKQFEDMRSFFSKTKDLLQQAKTFKKGTLQGQLLIVHLPLKDRKLLAETADQLKTKLSSGVIIAIGEDVKSHPIVVTVTKNLQKDLPAGDLLKNKLSSFLNGKGGGQSHFAQGSISDKSRLPELEEFLLKSWE